MSIVSLNNDSQSRRSKVVRGQSQSSRPNLSDHARLSQACSYKSESLGTYWSYYRPGGRKHIYQCNHQQVWAGGRAQARGWGAPARWLREGGSSGSGGHREH
eukprot:6116096-Pleurochrysis_carterae.AAC.1